MSLRIGRDCKVTIGSPITTAGTNATVSAQGTWKISGITADQMEITSFTDNWKTYLFGTKDGGTITFSGFFDPEDTSGQVKLMSLNLDATSLTTLKLFVDSVSYWMPCHTTGWFASPSLTSNQNTKPSCVFITSWNISADKAQVVAIDFTAKVSGNMSYY